MSPETEINTSDLVAFIVSALADLTGAEVETVRESSLLTEDLGLDSLAQVDLVTRLEEEYHIVFPEERLGELQTVSDLIEQVRHCLALTAL